MLFDKALKKVLKLIISRLTLKLLVFQKLTCNCRPITSGYSEKSSTKE